MKIATKITVLIGVVTSIAFGFQNCSKLLALNQQTNLELNSVIKPFSLSQTDATYVWSLRTASSVEVTRIEQVTRWLDMTGKSMGFFPPLMANTAVLNYNASALLEQTSSGPLLKFDENNALVIEPGDYANLLGQAYSMAMYFHSIVLPATAPKAIRLLEFSAVDGSQSGYVGLDVTASADGTQAVYSAYEFYDTNTVATCTLSVPVATLAAGTGIAIRYANDPSKMALWINDLPATCTQTGTVPLLGYATRQLVLHSIDTYTAGSFELAEFGLWLGEVSDANLPLYAHNLKYSFDNYGTQDVTIPAPQPVPTPPSTPNPTPTPLPTPGPTVPTFASVQANFAVCVSCHSPLNSASDVLAKSGTHGAWVTVGNSANSNIIKSLNGASGYTAMPYGLASLSTSQIGAIAAWIDAGAH